MTEIITFAFGFGCGVLSIAALIVAVLSIDFDALNQQPQKRGLDGE